MLHSLIEWVHALVPLWFHLLEKWGYAGVIILMAMESSIFPVPSEIVIPPAAFLAAQGRSADAREWIERVLRKKATMPDYIRRRERPWFRRAKALKKRLPAHG